MFRFFFWRRNLAPGLPKRSLGDLTNQYPEFARLLAQFGAFPGRAQENQRILKSLQASVQAFINDFPGFRSAVFAAARMLENFDSPCEEADRQLLFDVMSAGNDEAAVLSVLNRNPLADSLPFVERIPVKRQQQTVWIAPVERALISKRPADAPAFEERLSALERNFIQPHPAIDEIARSRVLDAIARVRRELERNKPYLPGVLQNLETRMAEYDAMPLEPSASRSVQAIAQIVDTIETVRSRCSQAASDDPGLRDLTAKAAGAVGAYLADSRLNSAFLTNYLLETLLLPALTQTWGFRYSGRRRMLDLVRSEVASGYYDSGELVRRLRQLEESGTYVSSFAYSLLHASEARPRSAPKSEGQSTFGRAKN